MQYKPFVSTLAVQLPHIEQLAVTSKQMGSAVTMGYQGNHRYFVDEDGAHLNHFDGTNHLKKWLVSCYFQLPSWFSEVQTILTLI